LIVKNQNLRFNNLYLFILFYISIIVGFYLGEDLNFGATADWYGSDFPVINDLSIDLKKTLLNYESYGHRHSPVYLIFLSFLKNFGFSYDTLRFFHLNISILLVYFFYKCLVIKFNNVEKNFLIILSLSIFLSPTFRSLAIWPSTRLVGLLFFVLSIYEFLKFQKNNLNINLIKNILFLIVSSYISPNFSLFIIYFFYYYLSKVNIKIISLILLFCILFSLPAIYYIFVLDINFLTAGTPSFGDGHFIGLSFNFSNKILIISSIILFHFIPFLINKEFISDFICWVKKNLIFVAFFFLINLIFFDYLVRFTGGGFFFQISNYLTNNNSIFYFFSFISLLLLAYFIQNNLNNLIIFFLLILSNIQNTIYHKYYDPLIMIIFFTIFNSSLSYTFFNKKLNLLYLYFFYLIFILMRVFKNNYLT
tara:strand:+ start:931 stop:2193 length:1263 start_codon:yes stop_codon:yes gene_type:complete